MKRSFEEIRALTFIGTLAPIETKDIDAFESWSDVIDVVSETPAIRGQIDPREWFFSRMMNGLSSFVELDICSQEKGSDKVISWSAKKLGMGMFANGGVDGLGNEARFHRNDRVFVRATNTSGYEQPVAFQLIRG